MALAECSRRYAEMGLERLREMASAPEAHPVRNLLDRQVCALVQQHGSSPQPDIVKESYWRAPERLVESLGKH